MFKSVILPYLFYIYIDFKLLAFCYSDIHVIVSNDDVTITSLMMSLKRHIDYLV